MKYEDLVHTETDAKGVTYKLYIAPDDLEVRGNAMASGDNTADRECEDEILAHLDSGDTWAWAQIKCVAEYAGFEGVDYLGACCYKDTADFVTPGGYWDDMKHEAFADLLQNVRKAIDTAKSARQVLRKLA